MRGMRVEPYAIKARACERALARYARCSFPRGCCASLLGDGALYRSNSRGVVPERHSRCVARQPRLTQALASAQRSSIPMRNAVPTCLTCWADATLLYLPQPLMAPSKAL